MGNLTIRKLDNRVKDGLRLRAASNGVSMEEEARRILASAVDDGAKSQTNLADVIAGIMDPLGGVELDLPPPRPRSFWGMTTAAPDAGSGISRVVPANGWRCA